MKMRGVKQFGDNVFVVTVENTRPITIKMEEQLVREMDRFWRERGYSSRSEFIRRAVRLCMEMPERCRSASA